MDAPRVSSLHLARPLDGGRWSLAPLALALLVALGFFVAVALPYLLLDPSVDGWLRLKAERALRIEGQSRRKRPVRRSPLIHDSLPDTRHSVVRLSIEPMR